MRKTVRVDIFVPGNVPREFRIGDKVRDSELVEIKTSSEQDYTTFVSLIYSDGSLVCYTGLPFMEVLENQPNGHEPSDIHPIFKTIFKPMTEKEKDNINTSKL